MNTDWTVPGQLPPDESRRRRWRGRMIALSVLAAVLVVVGILTALAVHFASGYFVFSPGNAPLITTSARCRTRQGQLELPDGTPCVRLEVPAARAHNTEGRLLMVDVEVSQASALQWVEFQLGLLSSHLQFVTVASYAGNSPTSELGCQDAQQMTSANQNAALAALNVLHYKVTQVPLGAQVYAVLPNTPAWDAGIRCDDLITAVDGKSVDGVTSFTDALRDLPPGTAVSLTVRPSGKKEKRVKVRLAAPTRQLEEQGFKNRGYLGVEVENAIRLELPFPVSVDAGAIGGPSAGLAFTLAILDTLSEGHLTGGHTVAATGTISPDGQVGAVGGVAQKTIAVERAGAQVFFVPAAEYGQAHAVASRKLEVVAVTSLQQVLSILQQRYGGKL